MTAHASSRRRSYSERQHAVESRPLPKVYRCTVCQSLAFDRIRLDSLFGWCPTCRLHRHFSIATDLEARRWAQARAAQADDPFYPTGTDW